MTSVDETLVFDIGMHHGEDTAFYVSRGYRVVGVEANPRLTADLRRRFRAEIADGTVTVEPVAVGPRTGTLSFAVTDPPLFSTADPAYLARARRQEIDAEIVEVEMTTLDRLIERHGTPRFMKVDIEGMDHAVVATLARVRTRPPLLSLESAVTGAGAGFLAVRGELRLLKDLGYRRFKLVDQSRLNRLDGTRLAAEGRPVDYTYEAGASGPFGDEAPARWRSAAHITPRLFRALCYYHLVSGRGRLAAGAAGQLRRRVRVAVRSVAPGVGIRHRWYDIHAAM